MDPLLKKGFGLGGRIDRALRQDVSPLFPRNGRDPGSDEFWMEQALLEAMNGIGLPSPNPAVGCVLVQEGAVVGKGHTQAYRKEHAERMAFRNLDRSADLSRATAYVTLEPCSHQGHQPPCVELLLNSPVPRIVIAAGDPDPRVNGEGIRRLRDAGKEVVLGVLENECRAWVQPFLRSKKTGRPVWMAKWAETPAGFLADAAGRSKWITNAASRAYTHWLRQKYDAIVVGAATFLADQPQLTVRDCAPPHHRNPMRHVFDPKGRLLGDPIGRLPGDPSSRTASLEGFTVWVSEPVLEGARQAGWRWTGVGPDPFHPVPESPSLTDPVNRWSSFQRALEAFPAPHPLQSVMVEGGAALLRGLAAAHGLDGVHQFVGAREFVTQCNNEHRVDWVPGPGWKLQCHQEFEGDVLREWTKED